PTFIRDRSWERFGRRRGVGDAVRRVRRPNASGPIPPEEPAPSTREALQMEPCSTATRIRESDRAGCMPLLRPRHAETAECGEHAPSQEDGPTNAANWPPARSTRSPPGVTAVVTKDRRMRRH